MILAGLRSLDSVSGSSYYSQLMEKLQLGSSELISGKDSVLIDLSSWHKSTLAPKIEIIQSSIENRHLLGFRYYSPSSDGKRKIEPYYLIFRWSSWYVWGYCLSRKDYRLFKLDRMLEVMETEKEFVCREVEMPDLSDEKIFKGKPLKIKILFSKDVKWRLIEEFGIDSFTETDEGKLLFTSEFSDEENLISWLMTFEDKAEILEPKKIRNRIGKLLKKMSEMY